MGIVNFQKMVQMTAVNVHTLGLQDMQNISGFVTNRFVSYQGMVCAQLRAVVNHS